MGTRRTRVGTYLATVALLATACGGQSDVTADDNASDQATPEVADEPVDDGPDTSAADQDTEGPHDADAGDDDRPSSGDELQTDDHDGNRTEAPSTDEVPAADDPTVEKIVEVPHVVHGGGLADLLGTLRADPDIDDGCFYLERSGGGKTSIAWGTVPDEDRPGEMVNEFRARFYNDGSPAELIDDDGTVLAREGDDPDLAGGLMTIDHLLEVLELDDLPCQFSDEVAVAWFE